MGKYIFKGKSKDGITNYNDVFLLPFSLKLKIDCKDARLIDGIWIGFVFLEIVIVKIHSRKAMLRNDNNVYITVF